MKDLNGSVSYGLTFSDKAYSTTLAANVAQSLTIPGDCDVAVFSSSTAADFYVNPEGTAAVPGGAFALSTSELNPVIRQVTPGGTLSFISSTACVVRVAFYASK